MKYKLILSILLGLFLISLVSATVTTTLNSPADGLINGLNNVNFNCSTSTSVGYLTNISLFTNSTGSWRNNQTSLLSNYAYNLTNMSDSGKVARVFTMAKNISMNNSYITSFTNYFFAATVDGSAGIKIGFLYSNGTYVNTTNVNTSSLTPVQVTWTPPANYSVTKVERIDIWIAHWSGTSGVYTVEGGDNATVYNDSITQTFPFNLTSNTLWNCLACDNSSTCSYATSNRTVNFNTIFNSNSYNTLGYETGTENYVLNITPTGYVPTNVKLVYNGTSYSITPTISGSGYLLSKTLQIPSSLIGSNTFYYTWNTSSTTSITSTTYSQTISPIQLGLCNATLTVPYLNFTFKDESTESWINATIPTSSFVYYLGDGTVNKTFTYSQTVNKSNYLFCFLPSNLTYYVDQYVQYKLGTDYPQRIYDPDLISYTNSTTNKTLYLLSSTDGIYVTFQVINSADQVLSGVSITGIRDIGGTSTIVATGTTGADGSVTFWLNPDFEQNFTFVKSGYTTYSILLTPTQSSYTITLSGGGSTIPDDYTMGIKNYIYPVIKELDNSTNYNFIFNVTSDYWELDEFGFNLRLSNGTIVGSDSSTVEGTGASFNYNTNNQTIIYLDYYWTINGNQTTGSTYFIVTNTLNTGWSVKTFFNDLGLYLDSGIFGLDEFGRYLIAFIVLFVAVGVLGYKYGMTNPIFVSATIFVIVFFLDVVTGLIPKIRGINHLLTYISGLILILLAIGEGSR